MNRHTVVLVQSALAVGVGGTCGSLVRIALGTLQPSTVAWPWMTILINLTGAFALGCLLEYFAATGEDVGTHRLWRLGLGTGVIGGYTTYSTFILEGDTRLTDHEMGLALAYFAVSVLAGLLCAGLGIRVGSHFALYAAVRHDPAESVEDSDSPVEDSDSPVEGGRR